MASNEPVKPKGIDVVAVATILVLIYAVLGAAVVILSAIDTVSDPQLRLSFNQYLQHMTIAAAGLAIGRGVNNFTKGT